MTDNIPPYLFKQNACQFYSMDPMNRSDIHIADSTSGKELNFLLTGWVIELTTVHCRYCCMVHKRIIWRHIDELRLSVFKFK